MSNIYPNIDGERAATSGKCMTCGISLSESNQGKTLNIEVDYMNGNDEDETYCRKHAHERRVEIQQIQKHQRDRHRAAKASQEIKQSDHFSKLIQRLSAKYEVKKLTDYQWRINGVLDLYPVNRNFHDIKKNERGTYVDAMAFCESFFCKKHRLEERIEMLEYAVDLLLKGQGIIIAKTTEGICIEYKKPENGGSLHRLFQRIFP